jgi:hypothetical protein
VLVAQIAAALSKSFPLQRSEEEFGMTFQVGLVGTDGVVLGSDQTHIHYSVQPLKDVPAIGRFWHRTRGKKLLVKDDNSVVCGYAGGPASEKIARAIVTAAQPKGLSEVEWRNRIEEIVSPLRGTDSNVSDEIIVVRTDTCDSILVVMRQGGYDPTFTPVSEHVCTGDYSSARFLAKNVWRPGLTTEELKKLAFLVLAYAHRENPTGVGGGFDILTLTPHTSPKLETHEESDAIALCDGFQNRVWGLILGDPSK